MGDLTKAKFRPAYREGFGVLNAQGDLWTPDVFDTEEAAKRHVEEFWGGVSTPVDLGQFTVIPVRSRTSITPAGRAALRNHEASE